MTFLKKIRGGKIAMEQSEQTEQKSNRAVVMVKETKAAWVVAGALAIIAILIAAGLFTMQATERTTLTDVDEDKYQAVFLVNGQVYFGKLEQNNPDYLKLSDIYYLSASQPPQPRTDDNEAAEAAEDIEQDQQLELIKLGDELHGPEDEMHIVSEQVLFWENLKNDGQVVEAINNHKEE